LCISRDTSKCILCGRCVNVCSKVQTVSAITKANRGFKTYIGVADGYDIAESTCVGCGQCIVNCPTGALKEKDYICDVIDALNNKDLHVVVQTAPAIRATIGEEFGMPIGTLVTGKLVSGLKRVGFDKVFDTDFAADLTIMEEGAEFIDRLKRNKGLPLITSCSSGWITFVEKFFPNVLDHVSTAKSPMEMMGTVIKTYYADREKIDPKKIYSVAIMPCSAKKAEIVRPELKVAGIQMIDVVLTTRELARLLKLYNIDLNEMEDEEFDMPMGEATGAGHIFGTTGGVMESALRTVTEVMTGKKSGKIDFKELRTMKGIREASVDINGRIVKVAVADGLSNVRKLVQQIADGKSKYDFIEVMTCPGGCIMGGGQPIKTSMEKSKYDIKKLRASALYRADKTSENRRSYENKSVRKLYKDYIGEINGERAHQLLHTNYHKQHFYQKKEK
jgi:NADP-reducing hydrogenase subunit HndD